MKKLYELHADICKTFSNPTRLEILYLLKEKELSVTEIIQETKLSQANVSQHLSLMKSREIVYSIRDGKNIYYKLSNPKIVKILDLVQEVLVEKLEENNTLFKRAK